MADNQHIIPRWYQKAWEDEQRRVCNYNLKMGATQSKFCYSRKSTRRIGSKNFAYEADIKNPTYIFDNAYTEFENGIQNDYAKMLCHLAMAPRYRLTPEERLLLCKVTANFLSREIDNVAYNYLTDRITSRFTLGLDDKEMERRWMNLCIMSTEGPMQHDWQLELLNGVITLYKFSEPCVMYTNVLHQNLEQRRTYLPLSPYMLVVFDAYGPYDSCIKYNFNYKLLMQEYLNNSRITDFYAAFPEVLHIIAPHKSLV